MAAVSSREDPRDAFVSPKYARLEDMPAGARVGTASLRRELMLRSEFPHLTVLPIRGNVGTRLSKLDNGDFDALVMAGAGLKRLKLEDVSASCCLWKPVCCTGAGRIGRRSASRSKGSSGTACLH